MLVLMNGRLRELNRTVEEDGTLTFVTAAEKSGVKAYRRTVILLMQKALDLMCGAKGVGVRVLQTTGNGQYCELTGTSMEVTGEFLSELKETMQKLAQDNLPIRKRSYPIREAIRLFHERGMTDKEKLVEVSVPLRG